MKKHILILIALFTISSPFSAFAAVEGETCEPETVSCDEGLYCPSSSSVCTKCSTTPKVTIYKADYGPEILTSNGRNLYKQQMYQSMDVCPWFVVCPTNSELTYNSNTKSYNCHTCELGLNNPNIFYYFRYKYEGTDTGSYKIYASSLSPDKYSYDITTSSSVPEYNPVDVYEDSDLTASKCTGNTYNIELNFDGLNTADGTNISARVIKGLSYTVSRQFSKEDLVFVYNDEIISSNVLAKNTDYKNFLADLKGRYTVDVTIYDSKGTQKTVSLGSETNINGIKDAEFAEYLRNTYPHAKSQTITLNITLNPDMYIYYVTSPGYNIEGSGNDPSNLKSFQVNFGSVNTVKSSDIPSGTCPPGMYIPDGTSFTVYHCEFHENSSGRGTFENCGNPIKENTNIVIAPTDGIYYTNSSGFLYYQVAVIVPDAAICPKGHYCDASCTAHACNAGTYQNQIGQTSCKSCTAGTYQPDTGQAICISCDAGTYQNQTGQASCKSCAAGTYQPNTGQSSCTNCPAGSATKGSSTTCTPCAAGTYSNGTANTSCSNCHNGQYQDLTGQSSCKSCDAGTVSANDNQPHTTCTSCGAGTYSPSGSNVCNNCPTGTYQPDAKQQNCISCQDGKTTTTATPTSLFTTASSTGATKREECYINTGKIKFTDSNAIDVLLLKDYGGKEIFWRGSSN
ncbi:MAG: hypothetical protein IKZ34_02350 [Alphaproteobacteria bacterium]|nr:hypothetical protein [Alphaproteobacteria bacterium]